MLEDAEVENQQGLSQCRQGHWEEAIGHFEAALALEPLLAPVQCNLGFALIQQGRLAEAAHWFRSALSNDPNLFQAHNNLGVVLSQQHRWEEAIGCFQIALGLAPDFAEAHRNLGVALKAQHHLQGAIDSLQRAIELQPHLADAHYHLGDALVQQGHLEDAIGSFDRALHLNPHAAEAYVSLCNTLYQLGDWATVYDVAQVYNQVFAETDDLRPSLFLIRTALFLGLHDAALEALHDLEVKVYGSSPLDGQPNGAIESSIPSTQLAVLYPEILFSLPHLRDDVAANARLRQLAAKSYFKAADSKIHHQPSCLTVPQTQINSPYPRIGILSKGFYRMSEGWCNRDVVRELAALGVELYLYATARFKPDDLTAQYQANARRFFIPPSLSHQVHLQNEQEILAAIEADSPEVLIDIDSVLTAIHPRIMRHNPAPLCLTWHGFEPPGVSRHHYFLCDRHTHPAGVEQHYYEQLVRLPDSFLAVSGFTCDPIDRSAARQQLGIAPDQVAYLCMAIGLKFSQELAKAQVQILRHVPNSVLLHKGSGDSDKARTGYTVIRETYQRECEQQGVDFDRIQFLDRTPTEEAHRTIYVIADVLLDTYPFNGVTHTLEALWFRLPIVTLVGEQFYARASYSFMQNVGLQHVEPQAGELMVGIAHTWEEYVEWGIRLGRDRDLRHAIQAQLAEAQAPESLAPLWNPRKFAVDLLDHLSTLRGH